MLKRRISFPILLLFSFFGGCANPIPPTGGPMDKEPPRIIATEPENGTVQFSGKEIVFTFDEYVQQTSFKQAFQIEPDLGVQFQSTFKGKSVKVQFENNLPENSTLVVTLGTALSDFKNNKIKVPLTLALSTGEKINSAGLQIKILSALDGNRAENVKVFLIDEDSVFTSKASYTAEPDTSGTVTFAYLPEQSFRVLVLEDINRNRKWDSFEWAQPSYSETVQTFSDSVVKLNPVFYLKPDTVKPRLEGIGLIAPNRLRLRFSEPVFVDSDSNFVAQSDSDQTKFRLLFHDKDNPTVYRAMSHSDLVEGQSYQLKDFSLIDAFRNQLEQSELTVSGEMIKDTTSLRIISVEPTEKVSSKDTVLVFYSSFLNQPTVDSLSVVEQEKRYSPYPFVSVDDHILKIFPEKEWESSYQYQFRLYNPATMNFLNYEPKIESVNDLGELQIKIEQRTDADSSAVVVEVSGTNYYRRAVMTDTLLVLGGINDAEVLVRAFKDLNQNQKWDSGSLIPYSRPEPFYINPKVQIQSKMSAELRIKWD